MCPPPRCFDLGLPPFALEAGPALPRLHLSGWWWGPAADLRVLEARTRPAPHASDHASDPAPRAPASPPPPPPGPGLGPEIPTVVLVHALTGDARAGGPGGWWAPLIGPGRALDPARTRILCFNNLGSCYGSFGPRAPDWPWMPAPPVGAGPLEVPAPATTWDQARAILRALDALGVRRVRAALGGSLGGMIVLALGALAPERFAQLVPVAASTAASPWIIGLNHIGRQTILLDPTWPEAERGLALARQLAQMSYRAEPGLEQRQGRALRAPPSSEDPAPFTDLWSPRRPYAQETYLEHQGRKLVARFDAPSYLVQLAAMDHHDLARRPPLPTEADAYDLGPDPWPGVGRLSAPIDAVGIDTDVLYFPRHMRALGQGPGRAYHEIASPHGHDAFLIEWDQLDALLRAAGAPFAEPT